MRKDSWQDEWWCLHSHVLGFFLCPQRKEEKNVVWYVSKRHENGMGMGGHQGHHTLFFSPNDMMDFFFFLSPWHPKNVHHSSSKSSSFDREGKQKKNTTQHRLKKSRVPTFINETSVIKSDPLNILFDKGELRKSTVVASEFLPLILLLILRTEDSPPPPSPFWHLEKRKKIRRERCQPREEEVSSSSFFIHDYFQKPIHNLHILEILVFIYFLCSN